MQMAMRRVISKAITSNCKQGLIVTASWLYSLPCNAENCAAAPVTGRVYSIINQASDMALDISHESHTLGANAIQRAYQSGDNQQWRIERDGSDSFRIVSQKSEQELTVAKSSAEMIV